MPCTPWGVVCSLTFTNNLLEAADLGDANCNSLLDMIARRPNRQRRDRQQRITIEVHCRTVSELAAGCFGHQGDGGRRTEENASDYDELGKRFYRYVVHMDDCLRPAAARSIGPGKSRDHSQ